ncbi:MAG: DNA polymerase III subunit gamma/tau [Ruminococcus sp.]|nr:DNA polymerase III subunit gamma/tau [Ruminococcus sp.]
MYKALYRKWRPLTFDDVISQQHITETLKNQIKNDKTAHAYLFTGSRGTGKTTCARILAKAVNCPNMKDGSPCLECDICRDADEGALTDIIEIDAASNNGVNDIRDLRDGAIYSPERCRYKVYIIDEVHMLSIQAFNALLKIMEEPPEYVKFILATTEIQKVPATITSRCQRYDFRRIKQKDIAARLLYIASQEDIALTGDGADMIAKIADGGMRDAVSLLDQCSVTAENIDADAVSNTAGLAGRDSLFSLLGAITDSDAPAALAVTDKLYNMSKDLTNLCEELILQLRNLMLIKASPENAEEIIVCTPEEFGRLKAIADKSELGDIMRRIEALQVCRERMTKVLNRRVEFEMSLIKVCGKAANNAPAIDNSEIYDKIKQLEDKLSAVPQGGYQPAETSRSTREVFTASSPAADSEPAPDTKVDINTVKEEELTPCDRWDEIMEEFRKLNPSCAGSLEGSTAATKGNVLCIFTPNNFFITLFKSNKENAVSLGRAVYNVLGQKYRLQARCTTSVEETRNLAEQLIQKAINSNVETAVDNNVNQ